jgi:hypothetical protein
LFPHVSQTIMRVMWGAKPSIPSFCGPPSATHSLYWQVAQGQTLTLARQVRVPIGLPRLRQRSIGMRSIRIALVALGFLSVRDVH